MMMLQATVTITDWGRFCEGLRWLDDTVEHPEGFVSLRVFRAQDEPSRVTMFEEWESLGAFERSFETYSLELRAEFMTRLGVTPDDFERHFWMESDPLGQTEEATG